MELIEAIKGRRSTRRFKDQAVMPEVIHELLDLATWAPSASNVQPWGFLVIQDQQKLKELSDQSKAFNIGLMKEHPRMEQYRASMENPKFDIFYGAPALILIYGLREHPYTPNDCSMVAQNLMLAAWEKSLGTCWVGFAHGICSSDEFKKLYRVPKEYKLVAPIIIGYRELEAPKPIPRKTYPVFDWVK